MSVVDSAELYGFLRSLRQGHAAAPTLAKNAFVRDLVLFRRAAVSLRGDFLQLLLSIHGRGVRRSRHGMRRLAASGYASPRQILRRFAPGDVALFPWHAKHFGDHAMDVADRFGAEVADSGLNCDPAIGPDHEESVVSDGSREESAGGYSDSAHFGPAPLVLRDSLLPLKLFRASIKGFFQESAGRVRALSVAFRPQRSFAFGALILRISTWSSRQLARRLRHQGFHQ